jgi:hypothetical protein
MLVSDKEHFDLFKKPDYSKTQFHGVRASVGSEDTGLYKRYVPAPRNIDYVTEYFIFEERKRRGFKSPFLTKNPYEDIFADYIDELEKKYAHLPPSVGYNRLLAELEVKHQQALASLR